MKLKRCPFCGSQPVLMRQEGVIRCLVCMFTMVFEKERKNHFDSIWNNRVVPAKGWHKPEDPYKP